MSQITQHVTAAVHKLAKKLRNSRLPQNIGSNSFRRASMDQVICLLWWDLQMAVVVRVKQTGHSGGSSSGGCSVLCAVVNLVNTAASVGCHSWTWVAREAGCVYRSGGAAKEEKATTPNQYRRWEAACFTVWPKTRRHTSHRPTLWDFLVESAATLELNLEKHSSG